MNPVFLLLGVAAVGAGVYYYNLRLTDSAEAERQFDQATRIAREQIAARVKPADVVPQMDTWEQRMCKVRTPDDLRPLILEKQPITTNMELALNTPSEFEHLLRLFRSDAKCSS